MQVNLLGLTELGEPIRNLQHLQEVHQLMKLWDLHSKRLPVGSQTDYEEESNKVKEDKSMFILLVDFEPLLINTFALLIQHVVEDKKGLCFGQQLRCDIEILCESS